LIADQQENRYPLPGDNDFYLSLNPNTMQARIILLCIAFFAASTSIAQSARKVDVYGNIRNTDAAARLDNFSLELMNDPSATAYIMTYGSSKSSTSVANARAGFAKNYLVNTRGIDPGRIGTLNAGLKKEPATELWIVPSGAPLPLPSPTVTPKLIKVKK
jgi:hypothetical protein